MTTASALSAASMLLSALLALLRAVEAFNQGPGPLAVNRSPSPAPDGERAPGS